MELHGSIEHRIGGVVYILQSVKRIRLRNARRQKELNERGYKSEN